MSKSFFRYVALAQSYQDKETAMVFDKLKEKTFYDYVKDSVPASALRRLVKTDESLAYVCD